MKDFPLAKAFTLLEPGPVVLVTTADSKGHNIMTISWTMVMGFTPQFALSTGPWNHSYAALKKSKACVIAIPTVDLIDQVLGIGTCTGAGAGAGTDTETCTDKFKQFGLTPLAAKYVSAPLIKECLANIECKVIDIITKHNIVVLEGVAAYFDTRRKEKRMIHAVGDGTFIVDGEKINRRKLMKDKLPPSV